MLLDADGLLGNHYSQLFGSPSESDLIVAAHQQITHEWWREARHRFDLYISEAVLAEIRAGILMPRHAAWPSWTGCQSLR